MVDSAGLLNRCTGQTVPQVRILSSPLEFRRTISKTPASPGFLRFWPIALAFCSAPATRGMTPAASHFASRTENGVVFRVGLCRLSREEIGDARILGWPDPEGFQIRTLGSEV